MANINPIGLGLPSESVKSLSEIYLSLSSTPMSRKLLRQRPQRTTFTPNTWFKPKKMYRNIPYNENGRRAPTTIHQVPNRKGDFRERVFFTNNISNTNRKPTGEKWTPNNARRKALNLQNELAQTRKIRRTRK